MQLRVCKKCKKTTDADPKTVKYCTACAAQLGVCRGCGKSLRRSKK